jgi:cell division septum initiation protein DivIVA
MMTMDDVTGTVVMTRDEYHSLLDRAQWAEQQLAELKTCIANMASSSRQSAAIASAVRALHSEAAQTRH